MIDKFEGKYRWLSNFAYCVIIYEGMYYPSTEAAYQASKTIITEERYPFQDYTPRQAKFAGKTVTLRPHWEGVKLAIMEELCVQKFNQPSFKTLLLATGEQELIEGNWWNDTFWGVCKGKGKNHLGRIIMNIRDTLNS